MADIPSPAHRATPPPMDGVSPPANAAIPADPAVTPSASVAPPTQDVARARRTLLIIGGGAYGAYILWCLLLISILPNATGAYQSFVSMGVLSCLAGAIVFL